MIEGNDNPDSIHFKNEYRNKCNYVSTTLTNSYTITDKNQIGIYYVDCGAVHKNIYLPTIADNFDRWIGIMKISAGAGNLKINVDLTTTDRIQGAGAASIWITTQYVKVYLRAGAATTWYQW